MNIKNIIFDFGNIISTFKYHEIVSNYTSDPEIIDFIEKEVIHSKEWLGEGLIDRGDITLEEAADRINSRTNYIHEKEVKDFLLGFSYHLDYNGEILKLINKLRTNGYKLYVLSNTTYEVFNKFYSVLNPLFDGLVLSYEIHEIKPERPIYEYLLDKYNLKPEECLFIDDNLDNINTANSIGIKGRQINKNDFNDILKALKEYKILKED